MIAARYALNQIYLWTKSSRTTTFAHISRGSFQITSLALHGRAGDNLQGMVVTMTSGKVSRQMVRVTTTNKLLVDMVRESLKQTIMITVVHIMATVATTMGAMIAVVAT